MLKYINSIPNDYDTMLNRGLMNKVFDRDLIELLVDSFRGLEILDNVKIVGHEWVPDEDKFDMNDHVVRRNSNKNKAIKNVAETRCGVLYINAEISGRDKSGKKKIHYIKKPIVVPLMDERGYYFIRGKEYFMIYQMVDKMMYPSIGAVTIKSLMPICVKTAKDDFTNIAANSEEPETYTIPIYHVQIFKAAINILLIYSHLTIDKTLNFMEVNRFISVHQKDTFEFDPDRIYFDCGKKSDIVVSVLRDPFDKFIYVRSVAACLVKLFEETKIEYKNINNWDEWMIIVGGKNTIRRGVYQHVFFNRLLDEITRKELKIDDYDKQNIYYLLRWIFQNFHVLWEKDNLSMINKRLRCAEMLSSLLTSEISKRINRIVSLGDKATIKDLLAIFRFPSDIFVSKLHSSGILRFNEVNNDIDMAPRFSYTSKGPNSLGGKDSKRIPVRQRMLHPSMLGYVDIASTSASSPGEGGDLTPYNDMTSLYFDDSIAENELHFKLKQYLDEHPLDPSVYEEFVFKCDNERQYNDVLNALYHHTVDRQIKIYATSNEEFELIIEPDPRDSYRKFDEKNLVGEDPDFKLDIIPKEPMPHKVAAGD